MKISGYQLNSVLRKASGSRSNDSLNLEPPDYLAVLWSEGIIRLPFDTTGVFWLPDRLPVFSDIRLPLQRSKLLSQLSMRSEDTGLVVDSLRSGGDAVYFATITKSWGVVTAWVDHSNPVTADITVKSLEDEYVLILTSFKNFVVPRVDS